MNEKTGVRNVLELIDEQLSESLVEGMTHPIYLLGRASLILGLGQSTGIESTKDIDLLDDASTILKVALGRFGKGQPLATENGMYIETVAYDFAGVPTSCVRRAVPIDGPWKVLRPFRLDWNDLAISKLKRFLPRDQQDITTLVELGLLDASILPDRFEEAFAWRNKSDDPADERAKANLERLIRFCRGETRTL
jgi:Nucleotidyltransferase of unknown function (DUF6036)